jgi:hypothetical protein
MFAKVKIMFFAKISRHLFMEIQIRLISLASTHKPVVGGSVAQPFVFVISSILSQLFRPHFFFLPVVLKPGDLAIV